MKNYIILLLVILMTTANVSCHHGRKKDSGITDVEVEIANWYTKREWMGGLDLNPDSSINKHELYIRYHRNKALWDKAFAFLRTTDLAALENGTYELVGQHVFATVSEYQTKESKDSYYESHKNYTDIQYVISGEEYIDIRDTAGLTIKDLYNSERDIIFYNEQDRHGRLAHPGVFFVLFPSDIHRPGIQVAEKRLVKKIVVKVAND